MYNRLDGIFSETDLERLNNTNILLVGIGGVGSFCFEALIRTGIKNITIIDYDTYEKSNLNRQLYATLSTLNNKKIEIALNHAKDIAKDLNIETMDTFLDKDTNINYKKYNYIIDACDSIPAKVNMITNAKKNGIKIISSLGVGNRKEPSKLSVTALKMVSHDPLGKKLKHELFKSGFDGDVTVVASNEVPIKHMPVSSYIGVTAYAGLLLADAVIKDIINE